MTGRGYLSPSYSTIAGDWGLWQEYIDPFATMTLDEFEAMGHEGRLNFLIKEFGPEKNEPEQD